MYIYIYIYIHTHAGMKQHCGTSKPSITDAHFDVDMHIYIYIYIYIYIHTYTYNLSLYIYIYMFTERERERLNNTSMLGGLVRRRGEWRSGVGQTSELRISTSKSAVGLGRTLYLYLFQRPSRAKYCELRCQRWNETLML